MLYKSKEIDFEELQYKEIILFGASNFGIKLKQVMDTLRLENPGGGVGIVKYFADNDVDKWDTYIDGVKVLSLDKFISYCHLNPIKVIIFISSSYVEIESQLSLYKLENPIYRYESLFNMIKIDFIRRNKTLKNMYIKSFSKWVEQKLTDNLLSISINSYINNCAYWICSIPKTGNTSMKLSLRNYRLNAFTVNLFSVIDKSYQDIRNLLNSLKGNIKIFTMVRDPLAQKISVVFQMKEFLEIEFGTTDLQEIFNRILCYNKNILSEEFLPYIGVNSDFELWFNEMKNVFGIDIFEYNFDIERGYSIIKKDNIEILVLKLEKISELNKIIGNFINIEDFKLNTFNDASHKNYKDNYEIFQKTFKIPENYFQKIYKNKYIEHFYSPDEINNFRDKWQNNVISNN